MIGEQNNTAMWAARPARAVMSCFRTREGGAMFTGGSLAMLAMSGMPWNYGWREG